EHPQGSGFLDAFTTTQLRFAAADAGNNSSVVEAWQFVSAHDIERRVNVAIIDGGFWLDNQGFPGSAFPSGVSDFHGAIPNDQYDFDGDDYLAGGPNPASCTGGTPCPWHGNNSASVAGAFPDNQYGSAGTGGWVSNTMMFKTNYTRAQVRSAVRTASKWGADVVSMSFSGDCNLDCAAYPGTAGFYIWFEQSQGVVFVACAGNDDRNVDVKKVYPCLIPGVICVGALNNGINSRIAYSNFGPSVDVYAPTNIASTPNPSTTPALDSAGGTSASAPFVAGVAAMMKAIDPSLTSEQTGTMLRDTAWQGTTLGFPMRRLNALAAVKAAANQMLPPDSLEPNDLPSTAKAVSSPAFTSPLTIYPDLDHFWFQLSDYASLDVDVVYMAGLGNVNTFLVSDGQTSAPSGLTVVPYDVGKLWRYALLGPGTYRLAVGGDDLNLYQLSVRPSDVALQPDIFEINDTLPSAAPAADGSYAVTLHVNTDVDYYAFSVASVSPIGTFTVALSNADFGPLSLYLYKDGADVGPVGPDQVSLDELGSYVVRVTGSGRTRYNFRLGFQVSPDLFVLPVPVDDFWVIDPTSAIDRVLFGERDGLVIVQDTTTLGRFQAIELSGDGLNATLYDDQGNVVTEGTLLFSPDTGSVERIGFENTSAGQTYVLVIERTEVLPDNALLPALSYSLRWSPAP
ncbi:MAG: S8/S53 family peptidase, partial [Myxococcales bacterium]|nr:S8/S53 family peptidase [Myxococcales bacterium]